MAEQEDAEWTSSDRIIGFGIMVLILMFISFVGSGNVIGAIVTLVLSVVLFVSLIPNVDLSELLNDELEPGYENLRPCPKCGENKIGRTATTLTSSPEFYCDQCGYKPTKDQVWISWRESAANDLKTQDDSQSNTIGQIQNEELWQQVKDRKAEGWEIEKIDDQNNRVIMKTTQGGTIGGHAVTGFLTGVTTLGLGNVAYSKLCKKKNTERIVLRADEDLPDDAEEPKQLADISDKLHKLKDLNDGGVITDEEFRNKKKKLLDEY